LWFEIRSLCEGFQVWGLVHFFTCFAVFTPITLNSYEYRREAVKLAKHRGSSAQTAPQRRAPMPEQQRLNFLKYPQTHNSVQERRVSIAYYQGI